MNYILIMIPTTHYSYQMAPKNFKMKILKNKADKEMGKETMIEIKLQPQNQDYWTTFEKSLAPHGEQQETMSLVAAPRWRRWRQPFIWSSIQ